MHRMDPAKIESEKVYEEMGLTDGEYQLIRKILKRRPNYTETGIFSVMWSEHCSYKSSKRLLRTLPSEGEQVIMGPGEGAGVVDIGDNQALVFKMESHNSPSYIEPFQGAATGVGGIVRDVFSMGARPIALLNSLRFGSLENSRTKYLVKEAVRGMAHYGNTLEVPTVGGEIQFDDCYEENPLVNAMCVGLIDQDKLQTGVAKGIGNPVIYAGGETGRDGIHGATFSSDEIEEGEEHTSAVAIGNPAMEKRLIEACLEVVEHEALVGMQDMGAAGLTSSASEMASKAGTGIELVLDTVPQREENMSAYEMMLSESQERMLLVAEKGREDEILAIFKKHDVPAAVIGSVIEEKSFRVLHEGKLWADVPVDSLDEDAPEYHLPAKEPAIFAENQARKLERPVLENLNEIFKDLLSRPTIASKKWAYEQFEGNTYLAPGRGAGILQIGDYDKGVAMTADCNSRYLKLDPKTGGKIAVAEAARNLVASGAKPLALTDGLNYGNPTNPEVFWEMEESIKGITEASVKLDVPVVSGNVSLYNQSKDEAIFPTPIIGMVGLVESLEHVTPNEVQEEGHLLYLLGETKPEFGGSELQHLLSGKYEGRAPELDLDLEVERQSTLLQVIREGIIRSATDLSEGGLGIALAESVLATSLGLDVELSGDPVVELFSESQSRFVISLAEEDRERLEKLFPEAKFLGKVTEDQVLSIKVNDKTVIKENTKSLCELWEGSLENSLMDEE